jgi:hypothetical protein
VQTTPPTRPGWTTSALNIGKPESGPAFCKSFLPKLCGR